MRMCPLQSSAAKIESLCCIVYNCTMYLHNRVYLFLNSDRAYPKFHVCIVYTICMYLGKSSYFNLIFYQLKQTEPIRQTHSWTLKLIGRNIFSQRVKCAAAAVGKQQKLLLQKNYEEE